VRRAGLVQIRRRGALVDIVQLGSGEVVVAVDGFRDWILVGGVFVGAVI